MGPAPYIRIGPIFKIMHVLNCFGEFGLIKLLKFFVCAWAPVDSISANIY